MTGCVVQCVDARVDQTGAQSWKFALKRVTRDHVRTSNIEPWNILVVTEYVHALPHTDNLIICDNPPLQYLLSMLSSHALLVVLRQSNSHQFL